MYRSHGTIGDISITWVIYDIKGNISEDFQYNTGNTILKNGFRYGFIEILIINDDIPEFDEEFVLQLVGVNNGAEINTLLTKSYFTIRLYNF